VHFQQPLYVEVRGLDNVAVPEAVQDLGKQDSSIPHSLLGMRKNDHPGRISRDCRDLPLERNIVHREPGNRMLPDP